jgi:hypothetical protein
MGLLDPTKRKLGQKVEDLQSNVNRDLGQVQQKIDQRIAEVRSYWQSKFGILTNLFNQNPIYKQEYGTPQEFVMGEEFEQFSLNMFSDYEYILVRKTHDFETNELRYVEESLFYDFTLRHRETGYEFAVECKYRSNLFEDKFMWAKSQDQFDRYKRYEQEKYPGRYFIMMGLGSVPSNPYQVFLVPLSDIQYVGLYPSFLNNYQIPLGYIRCDGMRLHL